ncbi:hypothetical protein [Hyphomonas sp.]|uniref:hypothetical protein n=1 Tax=Hyphomonas sp. TaxID=87 RepID=UPI00352943B4
MASAELTAEPADSAPFEGAWAIAPPDVLGYVVDAPLTTCDAPATIDQVDEDTIHVAMPRKDLGDWDVKSFEGKNPWLQNNNASLVAVWVTDNAFLLAEKDETGTKSDWENAKKWSRCPKA